jgi:ABC-type antimicrobial peptide transport system, ATPase component
MDMNILDAHQLKKYYGEGEETQIVRALDGVDLGIKKGEFVTIVGMSGSGKSTLLHMLGGLDTPTEGKVLIKGHDLSKMTSEELTIFRRRHIGFIFQNYNLVPILNVYENIVLPITLDKQQIDALYVDKIIETLGLSEKKFVMPNMLSGGQQQRVAIARALASKPAIILADEPTGNLDSKTSQDVLDILKMTSKKFNQTIILITHNDSIAELANRTIHIGDGKIIKEVVRS